MTRLEAGIMTASRSKGHRQIDGFRWISDTAARGLQSQFPSVRVRPPASRSGHEPLPPRTCPVSSVEALRPADPARRPPNFLSGSLLSLATGMLRARFADIVWRMFRFMPNARRPADQFCDCGTFRKVRWLDGNLPATIMPVAARKRQAGVAQLVEHHVANVVVEGSSPFTRSFLFPGRDIAICSGSRPAGRSARQHPSQSRSDAGVMEAVSVEG